MSSIKWTFGAVAEDNKAFRQDINGLKADNSGVKIAISGVTKDGKNVKTELERLRIDVQDLKPVLKGKLLLRGLGLAVLQ